MDMLILILKKKLNLRKIKMEICDWLKNYWVEELKFTALANVNSDEEVNVNSFRNVEDTALIHIVDCIVGLKRFYSNSSLSSSKRIIPRGKLPLVESKIKLQPLKVQGKKFKFSVCHKRLTPFSNNINQEQLTKNCDQANFGWSFNDQKQCSQKCLN